MILVLLKHAQQERVLLMETQEHLHHAQIVTQPKIAEPAKISRPVLLARLDTLIMLHQQQEQLTALSLLELNMLVAKQLKEPQKVIAMNAMQQ